MELVGIGTAERAASSLESRGTERLIERISWHLKEWFTFEEFARLHSELEELSAVELSVDRSSLLLLPLLSLRAQQLLKQVQSQLRVWFDFAGQ